MLHNYPYFYHIMARLLKEKKIYAKYKKAFNIQHCIDNLKLDESLTYLTIFRIIQKCIIPKYYNIFTRPKYSNELVNFSKDLNRILIEFMRNDIIQLLKKEDIYSIYSQYLFLIRNFNLSNYLSYCQKYNISLLVLLSIITPPMTKVPRALRKLYQDNIHNKYFDLITTKLLKNYETTTINNEV